MNQEQTYVNRIEGILGKFEENEKKAIRIFDKQENVEITADVYYLVDDISSCYAFFHPGKGISNLADLFNENNYKILDECFNS